MTRTSLVVGGTGGIGGALVRRLAQRGDRVIFTFLRAHDSAATLAAGNPGAVAVQLDVRNSAGIADVVALAGPDLSEIHFCAASGAGRPLSECRAKHWNWAHEINVRAFMLLYSEARPVLVQN